SGRPARGRAPASQPTGVLPRAPVLSRASLAQQEGCHFEVDWTIASERTSARLLRRPTASGRPSGSDTWFRQWPGAVLDRTDRAARGGDRPAILWGNGLARGPRPFLVAPLGPPRLAIQRAKLLDDLGIDQHQEACRLTITAAGCFVGCFEHQLQSFKRDRLRP